MNDSSTLQLLMKLLAVSCIIFIITCHSFCWFHRDDFAFDVIHKLIIFIDILWLCLITLYLSTNRHLCIYCQIPPAECMTAELFWHIITLLIYYSWKFKWFSSSNEPHKRSFFCSLFFLKCCQLCVVIGVTYITMYFLLLNPIDDSLILSIISITSILSFIDSIISFIIISKYMALELISEQPHSIQSVLLTKLILQLPW